MRAPVLTRERARSLRRAMSLPEVILWEHLRGRRLRGLRFRRQHPLGPYVADFYCAEARVAVEVDGWTHDTAAGAAHDRRRDRLLADMGVLTLRCEAAEVLDDDRLEGVLAWIAERCLARIGGS